MYPVVFPYEQDLHQRWEVTPSFGQLVKLTDWMKTTHNPLIQAFLELLETLLGKNKTKYFTNINTMYFYKIFCSNIHISICNMQRLPINSPLATFSEGVFKTKFLTGFCTSAPLMSN